MKSTEKFPVKSSKKLHLIFIVLSRQQNTYQKKKIADQLFFLPKPVALKLINQFFDTRKMRADLNTQANLEKATSLNTLIISGDADRELNYLDAQKMTQTLKEAGHSGIAFEKMEGVAHSLKEKDSQALLKILGRHLAKLA